MNRPNFIFDFADTLSVLVPQKEKVLDTFLREHHTEIPAEEIARCYVYMNTLMPYSSVSIKNPESKKAFYIAYNETLFNLLGASHIANDVGKAYHKYFIQQKKHWIIKSEVIELLRLIKRSNVSTALLSNFDSNLGEILDRLKVKEYFDFICVSQEIGDEKPNVSFYQKLLDKTSFTPADTIYIGDSYFLDYVPALAAGLQAYLLDELDIYRHIDSRFTSISQIHEFTLNSLGGGDEN